MVIIVVRVWFTLKCFMGDGVVFRGNGIPLKSSSLLIIVASLVVIWPLCSVGGKNSKPLKNSIRRELAPAHISLIRGAQPVDRDVPVDLWMLGCRSRVNLACTQIRLATNISSSCNASGPRRPFFSSSQKFWWNLEHLKD